MKEIKKTRSICPACYKEIPASIFERDGKVYMNKECPEHGITEVLLEKDSAFYRKILSIKPDDKRRYSSLTITMTHKCNNKCRFCYLPQRDLEEKGTQEIKESILRFSGRVMRFSGGEPTLRGDIFELIRFSKKHGKTTCLLTNGINLADMGYVKKLEQAGLDYVNLSLSSLDRKTLERMEYDVLEEKMMALSNLRKTRINSVISFMAIRGVNDSEIRGMLDLSVNNTSIRDIRIRSAIQVGRHGKEARIFLSEIFDTVSSALGIDSEQLFLEYVIHERLKRILRNPTSILPCSFSVTLFRGPGGLELLSQGLEFRRFHKSMSRQLLLIGNILRRRKLLAIKAISNIIFRKNNRQMLHINLRSWPDKYTIDLDNIKHCPTSQLTSENKLLPFCYAIIMNDVENQL